MDNQEVLLEQVEETMGTIRALRDISDGTAPEEVYSAMLDEGLVVVSDEWFTIMAEIMNDSVNKGVVIGTLGTLIGLGAMKWIRKIL